MSKSKHVEKAKTKFLETFLSIKFYIMTVSTVFFYTGKLTEQSWIEIILVVGGFRVVNEVASMFTGRKDDSATPKP